MFSSDEDSGDASPQAVPFPISRRASRRKRSRLSRPSSLPSACEESAHYPVFNPEDPRHNPALATSLGQDSVDNLPQAANSAGSIRWMQGLPGRSLRRARSGLQALRSGLHRRPDRSADGGQGSSGLWSSSDSAGCSSDPHGRHFSSTVSEASTEEDYSFGTDLYRTGCNCPDSKDDVIKDIDPPSYFPPSHLSTIPASSTGSESILAFPIEVKMTDAPASEDSPAIADAILASSGNALPVSSEDESPTQPTMRPESSVPETCSHTIEQATSLPNSPNRIVPDTPAPVGEDEPECSAGKESPCLSIRETDTSPVSRILSSGALTQSLSEQFPSSGSQTIVTTGEQRSTGASDIDTQETRPVYEEPRQILEADHLPFRMSLDTAPEVELGDLGGMDYYLSLDTLSAIGSHENKSSSEEPSPDSLSDEEGDARLSPWIPADKADRLSPLSLQDEYFLVDGKSTDLRPDRGDNPVKSERAFAGDGGLHTGPGLDRNAPIRPQEIPEIIGPGGPMGMPSPRPFRRDREGSDSTEEYLVTYSLLHQHYFS